MKWLHTCAVHLFSSPKLCSLLDLPEKRTFEEGAIGRNNSHIKNEKIYILLVGFINIICRNSFETNFIFMVRRRSLWLAKNAPVLQCWLAWWKMDSFRSIISGKRGRPTKLVLKDPLFIMALHIFSLVRGLLYVYSPLF